LIRAGKHTWHRAVSSFKSKPRPYRWGDLAVGGDGRGQLDDHDEGFYCRAEGKRRAVGSFYLFYDQIGVQLKRTMLGASIALLIDF